MFVNKAEAKQHQVKSVMDMPVFYIPLRSFPPERHYIKEERHVSAFDHVLSSPNGALRAGEGNR